MAAVPLDLFEVTLGDTGRTIYALSEEAALDKAMDIKGLKNLDGINPVEVIHIVHYPQHPIVYSDKAVVRVLAEMNLDEAYLMVAFKGDEKQILTISAYEENIYAKAQALLKDTGLTSPRALYVVIRTGQERKEKGPIFIDYDEPMELS